MSFTCETLLVVAHPDNETIGMGISMGALHGLALVYVTDGAPRDARFRRGPALDYAELRRDELETALAAMGRRDTPSMTLGFTDLEVPYAMRELAIQLAGLFRELDVRTVITHAFEGGHPDHDAIAWAAHAAAGIARRRWHAAPDLWEVALYHGEGGRLHPNEFLPEGHGPALEWKLAATELARKRDLLGCFRTQGLAPFQSSRWERLRPAVPVRFDHPPHPGPLWYEQIGLPWTFHQWQECVREADEFIRLRSSLHA